MRIFLASNANLLIFWAEEVARALREELIEARSAESMTAFWRDEGSSRLDLSTGIDIRGR